MSVFFILLAVVLYLAFLVDWANLRPVVKQGGWASFAVYIVLTVLIIYVVSTPETGAVAPPVHH